MILGERVRLRRVERNDLPRFVEWLNDPEVRRHLALVYPPGLPGEERWFESQLALEPACQPFALEARRTPGQRALGAAKWSHVGAIGFHSVDWRNRTAEAGIMIGRKDVWGVGYGTDAMRALCGWGFGVLNLNRVFLRVFEDNARGIRSYEKVGFRHEGRLRQDRFHEGRYWDTLVMGLLREEFESAPVRRASGGARAETSRATAAGTRPRSRAVARRRAGADRPAARQR